ncbi:hypothetical protein HQ533_02115 [Candidatus Woesearchaeota archaeon]|nr:hypothetical protein [Candidatus Woesearchaeota archaeon]
MAEEDFVAQQQEAKKEDEAETPFQNVSRKVTTLGSRLRVLEERYSNIRKKTQMTDQALLEFERDMRQEIRSLNQDLLDIKRSVSEINENLIQMSAELQKSVKQSDFKVVEKYVDMWQPMDFVTREELNKALKNK